MNLLHAFPGFGALAGPFLSTAFMQSNVRWESVFIALAAFCAAILVLEMLAQRNVPEPVKSGGLVKSFAFYKSIANKKILLLCVIIFCYTGYVFGISAWMPAYLRETLNAGAFISGLPVSALWGGVILGRVIYSVISDKFNLKRILVFNNSAASHKNLQIKMNQYPKKFYC